MNQQGPLCLRVLLGVSSSFSGGFLVGPSYTRSGRRPAFLSGRLSKSSQVILFEVALLMFDGSYNQLVFSAGSPFIRRALAYPHTNSEPPPQTSSFLPHGNPNSNITVHANIRPSASSRYASGCFFVSQWDFNLDFGLQIR